MASLLLFFGFLGHVGLHAFENTSMRLNDLAEFGILGSPLLIGTSLGIAGLLSSSANPRRAAWLGIGASFLGLAYYLVLDCAMGIYLIAMVVEKPLFAAMFLLPPVVLALVARFGFQTLRATKSA